MPTPIDSSMPRCGPLGPAADALRFLLHPSTKGIPEPWRARLRTEGWFSAWREDVRCARAIPVVAGRLARTGGLEVLDREDRALAEAALAWGRVRAAEVGGAASALALACGRVGAEVLLGKGAALHGLLYEEPADRPSADIDAFVRHVQVPAFHASLLGEGFRPFPGTAERVDALRTHGDASLCDLSYLSPAGLHVELKADPIANGLPIRALSALFEDSRPSPLYEGLRVPSADTMVLQQAASIARRDGLDLLAHAELAAVLRRRGPEVRPARIWTLLAGEGLGGVLHGVFRTTEALFPGTVPAPFTRTSVHTHGYAPAHVRGPHRPHRERWISPGRWIAQGVSGRRATDFLTWVLARALPPAPLLRHVAHADAAWMPLQAVRRLVQRLRRT